MRIRSGEGEGKRKSALFASGSSDLGDAAAGIKKTRPRQRNAGGASRARHRASPSACSRATHLLGLGVYLLHGIGDGLRASGDARRPARAGPLAPQTARRRFALAERPARVELRRGPAADARRHPSRGDRSDGRESGRHPCRYRLRCRSRVTRASRRVVGAARNSAAP